MTDGPNAPIDAIIVASWFPAYDDPGAGRFVADQVEALDATAVVRPSVVSFDLARLSGGATSRTRQAVVVLDAAEAAIRSADAVFVTGARGIRRQIPVARLVIPHGLTSAAGVGHAAVHRGRVLEVLGERLTAGRSSAIRPGIVHAHTAYPDGAAAIALADRLGWPLIVTEHASFVERLIAEPTLRERYAGVLARATRFFAVGSMLAGELRAAFPEHGAKVEVLPNAVPVDLFRSLPLAERVADQLLFVGYWTASKGLETLIRAVAIARARRPTITLRLVGRTADASEERAWRELAAELGIVDAVRFDSARDRAGVADAMAEASIFVHPSPRETFGVVAVEALASGLPLVATDSGGVTEILGPEPDTLGAIVPPNDPPALATAILATLERRASFDPAVLRASVERRYGSSFVVERLILAYREALVGRTGDAGASGLSLPLVTGGGAAPLQRPIVVVALDRSRAAERIGPLPDAIRRELILVTAVEPGGQSLPVVGRIVEVAVDASWNVAAPARSIRRRSGIVGRLARLVADPGGTISRRLGRGAGSDRALAPATDAVARVVAALPGAEVIALDGHDHVTVAPLVRSGAIPPLVGGLRRLADERGGED
jgi:glycosyltransferase involved in cell wall biosynthesis